MKVSLNWVKKFTPVTIGVDELVDKIGSQLGAVEEVVHLGSVYKGIVIARVVSCEKHDNADKLKICRIDDGGKVADVERDNEGYVQVVCGAPNVREGLLVAWLPPGVTVPISAAKDPFVLEAREIRGTKSNGMLASAHELAVSDDHTGIVELSEGAPGDDFAGVYELDDEIIDIENKMFTHRPDLFAQLGVAREIAGITHQKFTSPDWYAAEPDLSHASEAANTLPLVTDNQLPELVPRLMLQTISGISVKPSSFKSQVLFAKLGVKPINNIVDITNAVMMLTGQPLHAYDYDKVKAVSGGEVALMVRHPRDGEAIRLLNGKTLTPRAEAIMIATDKALIGVGGIMGGADTEVDENTTRIILECGTFDMYSVRKTSMEHGLFTEASTRFNKGQSPFQNARALKYAIDWMLREAGGTLAGPVVDLQNNLEPHRAVELQASFINERLGLSLNAHEIAELLTNVECAVTVDGEGITVIPPFWRTDIQIAEDVVEEVGRLYGYDALPVVLPQRTLAPAQPDTMLALKSRIREILCCSGANEVLTYSFVHGNLFGKADQDAALAFQLSNALSPDLQHYRLSLTPSLLDRVIYNLKADYVRNDDNEFVLFEINKVHGKTALDDDGLPKEHGRVAMVIAADDKTAARKYSGVPYFAARKYVTSLAGKLGIMPPTFVPLTEAELPDHDLFKQMLSPFEATRSALVYYGDQLAGIVGEYKQTVAQRFKLPAYCAGCELFLNPLLAAPRLGYQAISRFPKTVQDISFRVGAAVSYIQLYDVVWRELAKHQDELVVTLGPLDIYQAPQSPDKKHITFRVWLSRHDRTMVTDEVNAILDGVATAAKESCAAERL